MSGCSPNMESLAVSIRPSWCQNVEMVPVQKLQCLRQYIMMVYYYNLWSKGMQIQNLAQNIMPGCRNVTGWTPYYANVPVSCNIMKTQYLGFTGQSNVNSRVALSHQRFRCNILCTWLGTQCELFNKLMPCCRNLPLGPFEWKLNLPNVPIVCKIIKKCISVILNLSFRLARPRLEPEQL